MPQDYMKAIEDLNDRIARPDPYQRITELETEIARLTSAGLNAAAGETIKADEANDYYAELERLRIAAHAATDDLAGEVLALRAQHQTLWSAVIAYMNTNGPLNDEQAEAYTQLVRAAMLDPLWNENCS